MKLIVTIYDRIITSVQDQYNEITIIGNGDLNTRIEFGEKELIIERIEDLVENIELLIEHRIEDVGIDFKKTE